MEDESKLCLTLAELRGQLPHSRIEYTKINVQRRIGVRMSYGSVDQLQKALSSDVFGDRTDKKKAAGRALGTILELISYYLIDAWDFSKATSIELRVPEYGNAEITHNVEFALHPIKSSEDISLSGINLPITSSKIFKISKFQNLPEEFRKNSQLMSSREVVRNAAVIYNGPKDLILATYRSSDLAILTHLDPVPYAFVECKRVGVEDGAKKGPTTIEKAKQGAYVAKSVSRLQKFRGNDGKLMGIYPKDNGEYEIREYQAELDRIIDNPDGDFASGLNLSIGIVSNHDNWFTDEKLNKELLVLKAAYDWLLFMSDNAMVKFVNDLLLDPNPKFAAAKNAFAKSYAYGKKENVFTKVKIQRDADLALRKYFSENITDIEKWFTVLQPENKSIEELKITLGKLSNRRFEN